MEDMDWYGLSGWLACWLIGWSDATTFFLDTRLSSLSLGLDGRKAGCG